MLSTFYSGPSQVVFITMSDDMHSSTDTPTHRAPPPPRSSGDGGGDGTAAAAGSDSEPLPGKRRTVDRVQLIRIIGGWRWYINTH